MVVSVTGGGPGRDISPFVYVSAIRLAASTAKGGTVGGTPSPFKNAHTLKWRAIHSHSLGGLLLAHSKVLLVGHPLHVLWAPCCCCCYHYSHL